VSNSGTNNAALDPGVDVDATGRDLVLEAIDAIEVVEAREVIELAIVRLAAQRRSERDLARLGTLLDGMVHVRDDAEALADHDFALHLTLCDAARNTLLAGGLSALRGQMKELIARSAAGAIAERRVDALIDSRAQLVDAIGRRDVERAADVFSVIMHDLRVESGRACPGTNDYAIAHRMPEGGMLDDSPIHKGDRP
jgi:DNA-binding FadR family transcriptional regulator